VGRWAGESPCAVLAAVGRNFVCSELALGATLRAREGEPVEVSAGADAHASTTRAAERAVFDFLEAGAAGEAKAANERVRAGGRAWPRRPPPRWKKTLSGLKPASFAGSLCAASVGTCLRACARVLSWAIFGGHAKVGVHP